MSAYSTYCDHGNVTNRCPDCEERRRRCGQERQPLRPNPTVLTRGLSFPEILMGIIIIGLVFLAAALR